MSPGLEAMRKRGKKRIPQDIKPWFRVKEPQETLSLPAKKVSRWVAGGRRDWNTRILVNAANADTKRLTASSLITTTAGTRIREKLDQIQRQVGRVVSLARYKNFCMLSGRGRTYNRTMLIARHNFRKLTRVGLVSGLIK